MSNKYEKNKKSENNKCDDNSNKKCEDNLGLVSMSYGDYVILASTLAYSLFQEMKKDDLVILINITYIVIANLQALLAQDEIIKNKCNNSTSSVEEGDLEAEGEIDEVDLSLQRKSKRNKVRNPKTIKRKKKKIKKSRL